MAGVESYGLIDGGNFVGVQAKWFTESVNAGQINQIRKSIHSALLVRPAMAHYIVCLPRNFQSDKIGRGKKLVEDTEEKRINELIEEIANAYPDLTLEFWNESRILQELQKPGAEGILKFWFTKEILSFDFVKSRFELAKTGWLKERYTPSLHSQGEIHFIVQQALYTEEARRKVVKEITGFISHATLSIKLIDQFNALAGRSNAFEIELLAIKTALEGNIQLFIQVKDSIKAGELVTDKISLSPIDYWTSIHKLHSAKLDPTFNNIKPRLTEALTELAESDLNEYVDWLLKHNVAHNCGILGFPGSGKTHGVANEIELRLLSNIPAIIIRAKDCPSANWSQILHHSLGGLNDWTDIEIFTAFESMAARIDLEKAGQPLVDDFKHELTNFLVTIDGIDESDYIASWRDRVKELEHWIKTFPRLRFVFTARSYGATNDNPSQLHFDDNVNIRFDLPEEGDVPLTELTKDYFKSYGINYVGFPWLLTAFENALSLKLFCEEYKGKSIADLDRPVIVGFTALLNNKINRIDTEFTEQQKPGWSKTDQVVRKSLINVSDNLILKRTASHDELADKLVADFYRLVDKTGHGLQS